MQENQIDLLSERDEQVIRRKQMLPTWMVKANVQFSFRLEVLLLLPYLFRLTKIKTAWESIQK